MSNISANKCVNIVTKILKINMFNRYLILLISLTTLISCAKLTGKFGLNKNKQEMPARPESLDFPPHYFLPENINNAPSHEDSD